MNKKLVLALLAAAALAACQKSYDSHDAAASTGAASEATSAADASADPAPSAVVLNDTAPVPEDVVSAPGAAAPAGTEEQTPVARPAPVARTTAKPATAAGKAAEPTAAEPRVTAPDLAYDYGYSVLTPPAMIPVLMRAHEGMCASAGPATCQVVGAKLDKVGKDDVSARLVVRGEPRWLMAYRTRIEEDAKAAGGKVEAATIETEDLSRSLVDVDAAMKTKIDLRDRLAVMVRTHRGKLSELVDLQERLTEVQGEIDAAKSELAVMKTRVRTAKLTISYASLAGLAPDSAFTGVAAAGHGFLKNVMDGVGVLISLLSYLLPFGLLIGAVAWVWRNRGGRTKARQEARPAE